MFKTVPGTHHAVCYMYPIYYRRSCLLFQATLRFAGQGPHWFLATSIALEPSPVLGIYLMRNKFLLNECGLVWETEVKICLLVLNCRTVWGGIMTDGNSDRYA